MKPARWLGALALLCVCTAQSPPAADPSGTAMLARAKAVFRAHVRPAFVSYVIVRRDFVAGEPDLENSYSRKIWCRMADRLALIRQLWKGATVGAAHSETVAFDERVDPGPPTADIFDAAVFDAAPAPAVPKADGPHVIGTTVTRVDFDYHVAHVNREGALWHLELEPKRDPQRNRIDDLWVDAESFEIVRVRLRDHLYFGLEPTALPEELDVTYASRDGIPVISAIRGDTPDGGWAVDYRFTDLQFADHLPDWYFTPSAYATHRNEIPG